MLHLDKTGPCVKPELLFWNTETNGPLDFWNTECFCLLHGPEKVIYSTYFRLDLLDLCSLLCFAESCVVSHVCPQASVYDDTGLSGYSSRAVSLLNVCQTAFQQCHHHSNLLLWLWPDVCLHVDPLSCPPPPHAQPSEYSWYSSGASSTRSSPAVSTLKPPPPRMMSTSTTHKTPTTNKLPLGPSQHQAFLLLGTMLTKLATAYLREQHHWLTIKCVN